MIIILILLLIILMTTKLERLERLRPLKQTYQTIDLKLPQFPNTAIDITPTTITAIQPIKVTPNDPLSSRGLDNWSLNNNLKQFSQTRQVGFFKNRKQHQRHKSNPYIIHKVRTPDLRTIDRDRQMKTMQQTLGSLRKAQGNSQSAADQDKKSKILLENVLIKHQKTNTNKFYPLSKVNTKLQLKKNPQETLLTQMINTNTTVKNTTTKSFRKNRFQYANQELKNQTQKFPDKVQEEAIEQPQQPRQCISAHVEEQLIEAEPKYQAPRVVSFELKRRSFNKTIESINRGFLSQTDSYFGHSFANPFPQPQLQLFVNVISQPQRAQSVNQRSSHSSEFIGEYDFRFQEERKARGKTPKKKNKYKLAE